MKRKFAFEDSSTGREDVRGAWECAADGEDAVRDAAAAAAAYRAQQAVAAASAAAAANPEAGKDYTTAVGALAAPHAVHADLDAEVALESGPLWSVSVAALPPGAVEGHLEALTCRPRAHGPAAPSFALGCVVGERLYMPPHYAAAAFPAARPVDTAYTAGEPMGAAAVYTGSLWRDYPPQQQAVDAVAAHLLGAATRVRAVMACLPCGHGKTNTTIAVAALHVRRVTLVLVHKRALVEQWRAEIRRFVPGAKVGVVTPERQRVEGVDFIVASLQCLHSHLRGGADPSLAHPYLATLVARVGFVVLDESHHGVANTFQFVASQLPAAYRLAVTATPRRRDGLFPQLQWIFGPLVFRSFRRPDTSHVVSLQYVNPLYRVHEVRWGPRRGQADDAKMVAEQVADGVRDRMVVNIICLLATTQARRVLVVTPRKAHVEVLAAALRAALGPHAAALARSVDLFVPEPPPRRLRGPALCAWEDSGPHGRIQRFDVPLVGVVSAEVKDHVVRELHYNAPVVVATSDMMEEGISYTAWDTLVDVDNLADCEQIVGRIQRAGPKKVPLVIDVWSPLSLYYAMHRKRDAFYREERMTVHCVTAKVAPGGLAAGLPDPEWWVRFDVATKPK